MIIPYSVDVPMERIPVTNWVLIGVTIIVSVGAWIKEAHDRRLGDRPTISPQAMKRLQELEGRGASPEEIDALEDEIDALLLQGLAPPLSLQPRDFSVLQLFTYQLAHGDIFHLFGNMIFLFVFGNAVNAKLGHALFVACYFLLGALGGLGWLLFGNGMPMVGASGAIMGMVGMFLIFFPRNEVTVFYWIGFRGMGTFEIASGWVIGFYMACDLIGTLWHGGGGVAYIAHLVGAWTGVALAILFLKASWIKSTRYEHNMLQILGWQKKIKKKKKAARDRHASRYAEAEDE